MIDAPGFVEPEAGGPAQYVQSAIFNGETLEPNLADRSRAASRRAPTAAARVAAVGMGHDDATAISLARPRCEPRSCRVRPARASNGGSIRMIIQTQLRRDSIMTAAKNETPGRGTYQRRLGHRGASRPGDLRPLR